MLSDMLILYYIVTLALHLITILYWKVRVTAVYVLAGELMYYTLYLQDTSKQLAQMQKIIQQAKDKQIPDAKPAVKEAATQPNTTGTHSPPHTQDPKHSGSLSLMPGPSSYNYPPLSHYTLAPYSTPCCPFSPHSTATVHLTMHHLASHCQLTLHPHHTPYLTTPSPYMTPPHHPLVHATCVHPTTNCHPIHTITSIKLGRSDSVDAITPIINPFFIICLLPL